MLLWFVVFVIIVVEKLEVVVILSELEQGESTALVYRRAWGKATMPIVLTGLNVNGKGM